MNQVIKKSFHSLSAIIALLFLFNGCASSSGKNYCDMVVENEAPQSQDNTDKAASKTQTKAKPTQKK